VTILRRTLLFTTLSLANLLVIWSPDVLPASLFAWTVVREGDVDYDEFTFIDRQAYFFRACGESTFSGEPRIPRALGGPPPPGPTDHVCTIFPPGAALLALPFLAPLALAGAPPENLPLLLGVGKIIGAVEEALAAALLIAALARVATPRWSLMLGLLYLLATAVRTTSSQALWQHGAVHLLEALALYLVVPLFLGDHPGRRRLVAAGLALGFAVVVRQTSVVALVAVLLALFAGGHSWRPLALGAVAGLLPLPLYDLVAFGNPLEQGYGVKPFATPLEVGLYGLLFSPSRGLFVYSPFLLFAIPPLLRAWRSPQALAPLVRWLGVASLGLVLVYATYAEWWGGRVFGARFLTDVLPALFLALALAPPAARWSRFAFGAAAAWALLLHTAGALAYEQTTGGGGRWDTERNVNFDPSPLFSWTDPQWLDILRAASLPDARQLIALALTIAIAAVLLYVERGTLRPSSTPLASW
jgi:hypothetical protein